MVPQTVFGDRTCVPAANVPNGPLHNNIPDPADCAHKDNNICWVTDFCPEHFDKMLYTKRASPSGSARTSRARTASPASTSPATR